MTTDATDHFVRVRGASEHNLRNVDVDIPRDAMVAFTGVSGSGKSSLAFGTLYAEAQRRYFESVAPYARRLLQQVGAPHVQEITGLPPAVALQQRRHVVGHPVQRGFVPAERRPAEAALVRRDDVVPLAEGVALLQPHRRRQWERVEQDDGTAGAGLADVQIDGHAGHATDRDGDQPTTDRGRRTTSSAPEGVSGRVHRPRVGTRGS